MSQRTHMRSPIGRVIATFALALPFALAVVITSHMPVPVTPGAPYSCTNGREITVPMNNPDRKAEVVTSSTYNPATGAVSNISLVTSQSNDGHTYRVVGGQVVADDKPLGAFAARWVLTLYSIDPSAVAPPRNAVLKLCLRP